MRNKKGMLLLVANLIIGLVILGAGIMFVTSDIGQPLFNALNNFMFPKLTSGCDTNSVNSIQALAYALNCTGMHHAGIDVTELCPPQKLFGTKVAACYGSGENYNCEVQGFELTKNPEYDESDPAGWITGMGDPNCIVYYEAFPEDQAADWQVRIEDFSWAGAIVGGVFNVVPVVGKGIGKGISKGVVSIGDRATKLVPQISIAKSLYKTLDDNIAKTVGIFTLKTFRNKQAGLLAFKNIFDISDKYITKELKITKRLVDVEGLTLQAAEDIVEDVAKITTIKTFEAIQTTAGKTTFAKLRFELQEELVTKMGHNIKPKELDDIALHQLNLIHYVTTGSTVSKSITPLQKIIKWNTYSNLIGDGGASLTNKEINTVITKGNDIVQHMPKAQRESILQQTKEFTQFFFNTKMYNDPVMQLGTLDILSPAIPNDIAADGINGLGTCAILVKKISLGIVACSYFTGLGVMAAYIDNSNEKYNPIGINSLGYKKNYYAVQTEKLADTLNYYYIALKRESFQYPKRFFLVSPCKTEKVIVKHEQIGCYYTECKSEQAVCCGRKVEDPIGTYDIGYYEWSAESDCNTYDEYVTSATIHNTGGVLKRGFLYTTPLGFLQVLYSEITEKNPETITVMGHEIEIIGEFQYDRDSATFDVKETDNNICFVETGINPPLSSKCQGAYARSDTDESIYTDNPIIRTIDVRNGISTNYRPEGNEYAGWSNTVEIEGAETYYRLDTQEEVKTEEFNIQAQNALDYNNGLTTTLNIIPLYMDAEGNGIKKCVQLTERPSVFYNPWAMKTKDNIDSLTVSVELDKTFEGTNYCFNSVDVLSGTLKGTTMITLAVADTIITGLTFYASGVVVPVLIFASGMIYEGVSYHVDKMSAWPQR
ncbi:MAG: hypothetical protein K0B07_02305 [DPANN group archaeon]|nr:hypothetical protein [DPANN group archaeon]